jgi:hypothetical protein
MERRMHPYSTLRIIVLVLWLAVPACYRNTVEVPRRDPVTEWRGKTVHSLFWGLVKSRDPVAENCAPSNALDSVRNNSNLGYSLLTVITLGIWSPTRLEWRCARLPDAGNGVME